MVQNNKVHAHHTKMTARRAKVSKKKTSNQKFSFLSRFIPRNRKDVIRMALAVIVVVAIAGAIPFPCAFAKSTTVQFATVSENYAGLELGDSKVLQEGRDGKKIVNVKSLQSIWGRLFGLQPLQQKEETSTITKKPVNKTVVNGTRKYQYMLCSDGSHRYYTDEQFKDPKIGFTSKSEDYCKENNQGMKLRLADAQDGTVNNQAPPNIISNTPVPKGCKQSSIPFGIEYLDASYLPRGTQQVASQGVNGIILSCPGEDDIKSSGVDQLVFVGTGKTAAEIQAEKDAEEARKQQEQAEKQNERLSNIRSCVSQLIAQGRQPASAQSYCEGQF